MILIDSSIWIDHLHKKNASLVYLLEKNQVMTHPLIIGELACGNIRNRDEVLGLLQELPKCAVATHDEVLLYIRRHQLMGKGIGYIDVHLLAASALSNSHQLWTRDKRLHGIAKELNLAFKI